MTVMLVVVVENMVLKVLFLDRGVEYVLIESDQEGHYYYCSILIIHLDQEGHYYYCVYFDNTLLFFLTLSSFEFVRYKQTDKTR